VGGMSVDWDLSTLRQTSLPDLPAADFLRAVEAWRNPRKRPSDVIAYVAQAEQVAGGALAPSEPDAP